MITKLTLDCILATKSLMGLKYDSEYKNIVEIFGDPIHPMMKVSKKSSIYCLQYDNILFYLTENKIVEIMIDLENKSFPYYTFEDFDKFNNFSIPDWVQFSDRNKLHVKNMETTLILFNHDLKINIDNDGNIHLISIGSYKI